MAKTTTKRKKGATSKQSLEPHYDDTMPHKARAIARIGATDIEMAAALGTSAQSLWNWQQAHPELREAIVAGRDEYNDVSAKKSLYLKVKGYFWFRDTYELDKESGEMVLTKRTREHVPPSDSLVEFYLCNRLPNEFKRRNDVGGLHAPVVHYHFSQLVNIPVDAGVGDHDYIDIDSN